MGQQDFARGNLRECPQNPSLGNSLGVSLGISWGISRIFPDEFLGNCRAPREEASEDEEEVAAAVVAADSMETQADAGPPPASEVAVSQEGDCFLCR